MLVFTIAHVSVIALRFREPDVRRVYRMPLSVRVGARLGAASAPCSARCSRRSAGSACWCCTRARATWAALWLLGGHRALRRLPPRSGQGRCAKRFTIPATRATGGRRGRVREHPRAGVRRARSTTTSSAPPAGSPPRRATTGEGGAVIEALYVVEVPMSLPLDARDPRRADRGGRERRSRRAKEVGEEYEGVVVATAMVRARSRRRRDRVGGQAARGRGDRARGRGADARRAAAALLGGRARAA